MNKIQQMFKLQKKLNDATNGEIWTEGATKEKRIISWHRCIYMEAAEAIDSLIGNIGKILRLNMIGKMPVLS